MNVVPSPLTSSDSLSLLPPAVGRPKHCPHLSTKPDEPPPSSPPSPCRLVNYSGLSAFQRFVQQVGWGRKGEGGRGIIEMREVGRDAVAME